MLRGWESNPRPRGYEPRELPLLYPAIKLAIKRVLKIFNIKIKAFICFVLFKITFLLYIINGKKQ